MLLLGDCNDWLKEIRDNSIDLLVSDPPYGIEFMGKDWDRALVHTDTWKECYRVLKQGKLAFVMCSPRQDVLSRMIISLEDAGFRTNYTSIYWTYASGFPKAANVSKLIDKRFKIKEDYKTNLEPYTRFSEYIKQNRIKQNKSIHDIAKLFPSKTGGLTGIIWNWENIGRTTIRIPTPEQYSILKQVLKLDNTFDDFINSERDRILKWQEAEREIIGQNNKGARSIYGDPKTTNILDITKPATEEAKKMEGAYVGFQPKPAVEVILVVSKGKTLTWLDDCRIPYQSEDDLKNTAREDSDGKIYIKGFGLSPAVHTSANEKGRFPANLLVSDDVLNNGKITKSQQGLKKRKGGQKYQNTYDNAIRDNPWKCTEDYYGGYNDEGSYSRYFSLDQWADKTLPFLIVPKASKAERNKGVENLEPIKVNDGRNTPIDNPFQRGETLRTNSHPTVKPLKLMSYLITLGSREGDLVLDPFCGSGTALMAADSLHRKWLGIERNPEYAEIIKKRLMVPLSQLKLGIYV